MHRDGPQVEPPYAHASLHKQTQAPLLLRRRGRLRTDLLVVTISETRVLDPTSVIATAFLALSVRSRR